MLMMHTKHSGSLNEVTRHKSSGFCEGNKDVFQGGARTVLLLQKTTPPPGLCRPINSATLAVTDAGWSAIKRGRYLDRHSKPSDGGF